jgi:beta-glucanase (GH16 family)
MGDPMSMANSSDEGSVGWDRLTGLMILASLVASASALKGGIKGAVAAPQFTVTSAQNGAVVVGITERTAGAKLYYTLDGSTPSAASQQFLAPFLVASSETVEAIAVVDGRPSSSVASRRFRIEIAAGTLIWSDEFTNGTGAKAQPNPAVWTYDKGASGYGNAELEDYCAWGSGVSPCASTSPNAFVGTDAALHIVAQQPASGVYTSARIKTQGLFSFRYGRLEFRAKVPEAQGFWPAGWLLGNTVSTLGWPASGEQDVLERVDAAKDPDWNMGSVHGPGFTGTPMGKRYDFAKGVTAADWHTYGMIWKPGSVSYYVDDPGKPYVTFGPADLAKYPGALWPFDGSANFILLNLAVGGAWPGDPNATTPFPAEMLVDYVRIYKE